MSLISGKYWTGDSKIKPEAWGPVEDVYAAVCENADKVYGIDPALFLMYTPVWEGSKQAKDIFGGLSEGTQNWLNWSEQSTNGTDQHFGITAANNKWVDYQDNYTLIFIGEPVPGYGDELEVFGIGRSNTASSSVRVGIRRSTLTENKYALFSYTTTSLFVEDSHFDFAAITNSGQNSRGLLYNKRKFVADLSTNNNGLSYDLGHIRIGNRASGDTIPSSYNPVTKFSGCMLIGDVIKDSQIKNIANYPYALLQPITRRSYFIPDDVVSSPTISYPEDDSTNVSQPITFSWSAVTDATNYQLQIAESEAELDTDPLINVNITAPTTIKTVSGLDSSTTYYTRVRAQTA